ncbi:MAG TPA: selenocysteine-specific translation elongation factor [Rhodococcus sp. (in: high G+C Gram-positive bacteria)]|uniref:selenocysteine-specific translation elongation factor n=1 Tax=Rhodococcus sp. SJ-3 TaxID=3454628 RepID=UPI002DA89DD5|nr:selenocysteine-specific translation elongation factor [Rhodococcus sp. (in: high G+C Gram-positive bacteria)]
MHVIATAGHVDHGKSTLVEALTGADPDRLAEERRRGLTIELGYCWTSWPDVGEVAFVDVPGHERFLTTMLAGVGPVPAVLFVVAADDPWMPQAAEHLAALDALGVRHAVIAVTRADLTDPGPAAAQATAEIARTGLAGARVVAVSGHTGMGLDDLRSALVTMVAELPDPDPDADVRLWVDRRFTVRGAGTVVTGTLPAGTVRVGDTLVVRNTLAVDDTPVRVRGVQALGSDETAVSGVARVALNLSGRVDDVVRGSVLVTPGAWHHTSVVDVRITGTDRPPLAPVLHIGAVDVAVRCRPLGDDLVRLTLDRALPLRIGDRALLRDPGRRMIWRADVLDPDPPRLRRRGAATRRARQLAGADGTARLTDELGRRGLLHREQLRRLGIPEEAGDHLAVGPWLVAPALARAVADRLPALVQQHARAHPLDPAVPLTVLASQLRLPTPDLVRELVRLPLRVVGGRVSGPATEVLPSKVRTAVDVVRRDLLAAPFVAPTADRLRELGLDDRALGAADRSGQLWRVGPGIVLLPDAADAAVARLRELEQPFTTSAARERLGTTRRVVLPLLDQLDRAGRTRRLADDRREVAR